MSTITGIDPMKLMEMSRAEVESWELAAAYNMWKAKKDDV